MSDGSSNRAVGFKPVTTVQPGGGTYAVYACEDSIRGYRVTGEISPPSSGSYKTVLQVMPILDPSSLIPVRTLSIADRYGPESARFLRSFISSKNRTLVVLPAATPDASSLVVGRNGTAFSCPADGGVHGTSCVKKWTPVILDNSLPEIRLRFFNSQLTSATVYTHAVVICAKELGGPSVRHFTPFILSIRRDFQWQENSLRERGQASTIDKVMC